MALNYQPIPFLFQIIFGYLHPQKMGINNI